MRPSDNDEAQRHQKLKLERARAREIATRTEDRVVGRQSLVESAAFARPASTGPGRSSVSELLPAARMPAHEFQLLLERTREKLAALEVAHRGRDAENSALLASEIAMHLEHARKAGADVSELERAASPLLAHAFQPSAASIAAAVRGEDRASYDNEAAAWKVAASGTRGDGERLPHFEAIQKSFGHHDISTIQAHIGGAAADATGQLGATGFAVGDHVAFASAPDLHTAAHEAAHYIQQRSGIALASGLDRPGDEFELHADRVADAVVRGESAAGLLDRFAGRGTAARQPTVQRKTTITSTTATPARALDVYLRTRIADLKLATRTLLAETRWPDPAPDVPFAAGGDRLFGHSVAIEFGNHLDEGEDAVARLLYPSNLAERFHRHVQPGTQWEASFNQAFAQLVEEAAKIALTQRVGPRYREWLTRVADLPRGEQLIAAHPLDPMVANALCQPRVVDPTNVVMDNPRGPVVLGKVAVHWLGKANPELWNFVDTRPANASIEEVAQALWHDSTLAFAVEKYGDVFRIAPAYARKAIEARFQGEPIGTADTAGSRATQLLALGTTIKGDAPTRQFARGSAATVQQVMDVERDVGRSLDSIRAQLKSVGLDGDLQRAYDARTERVAMLSSADPTTLSTWAPVLEFQHAQLLTIAPRLTETIAKVLPLRVNPFVPSKERERVEHTLQVLAKAAALSDQRDASTKLLNELERAEVAGMSDQLDAAQLGVASATTAMVTSSRDHQSLAGSSAAHQDLARARQNLQNGHSSPYERQMAMTLAGEVALDSRMLLTKEALYQMSVAANDAGFGNPEMFRQLFPKMPKTVAELIDEVTDHLRDVEKVWDHATKSGTLAVQEDPHAPDDWTNWQGRAVGLAAASRAFGAIAGDQGIAAFVSDCQKEIRHQRFITTVISFAKAVLLTVVTGMAAAQIAEVVAGQIASEAVALGAEIVVEASINSLVQFVQSDQSQSIGWTMLENSLMGLFSKGLGKQLQTFQEAAHVDARALAQLPHLTDVERAALLPSFTGTQLLVDVVGGVATQWAAHQLVATARRNGEQLSGSFAETVLQQGAAVGLGRFFHGAKSTWLQHRAELQKLGFESSELFAARDAFYERAARLANSLSPPPEEATALAQENRDLTQRELQELAEWKAKGHAPVEAHNHYMGNVPAEAFVRELELSGAKASAGESRWEPLLDEIEKLSGSKLAHDYKDATPESKLKPGIDLKTGQPIVLTRGPAGDALVLVKEARNRISKLRQERETVSEPRRVKIDADIDSIAKTTVEKCLSASDETNFHSSYEVRDELIKNFYGFHARAQLLAAHGLRPDQSIIETASAYREHFKDRPAVLKRIDMAIELQKKIDRGEITGDSVVSARAEIALVPEQVAYDVYIEDTVLRLVQDGLQYTEQSSSAKKLIQRIDAEQLDFVKKQLKAEHPELAKQIDAIEIKQLAMVATNDFGAPDKKVKVDDVKRNSISDEKFESNIDSAIELTRRNDVVGVDIAGMEHLSYEDPVAKVRLRQLYDRLCAAASPSHPLVFRPHVGEGAIDVVPGKHGARDYNRQVSAGELTHYTRARENIGAILEVLENVAKEHGGSLPSRVQVRFGHVTHATPEQVVRMNRLGIVAEVNLGSNAETGALDRSGADLSQGDHDEPPGKAASSAENFDDHSLGILILNRVEVVLSTDGHEVMNTSLAAEYRRAVAVIHQIIHRNKPVRLTPEQTTELRKQGKRVSEDHPPTVTFGEMLPDQQELFLAAEDKFYRDAKAFYERRPRRSGE